MISKHCRLEVLVLATMIILLFTVGDLSAQPGLIDHQRAPTFYIQTENNSQQLLSYPAFTASERLKSGARSMEVASYARVEVVDWDEDGDLDVLLGETDAYINLYLNTSNPSSVSDPFEQLPTDFLLAQNYPNPFNSRTTICYYVPQPGIIKLSIFNLAGQLVETVLNESNMPGLHSVRWDASTISSGTYIIRLSVDQFSEIRKCIIVK